MDQVARTLSEAAGRTIPYEAVDDATFREYLAGVGWDDPELEVILGLFGSIREGGRAPVDPALAEILDRTPRDLASFAAEKSDAWR